MSYNYPNGVSNHYWGNHFLRPLVAYGYYKGAEYTYRYLRGSKTTVKKKVSFLKKNVPNYKID